MIYSRYSIVLKNLMDNEQTAAALQKALSSYPIYTPKNPALYTIIPTREEINTKLLNHYKYREIGFETIGRFLDELEIAMCEIMPYYNQLMSSEDMMNGIEDIFGNIDITEYYDESSSGSSKSKTDTSASSEASSEQTTSTEHITENNSNTSANTTALSKNIESQTPANELTITAAEIDSVGYADKASWNKDENTSSSESTDTSTGSTEGTTSGTTSSTDTSSANNDTSTAGTITHTLTRKGNQGVNTYAHDMLEFRELFLNIVQQIINNNRIKELFMLVY